ncbi:MAG: type II secretion system protein [Candidatus Moranbacteria bacterium]|nr:type II secretion system protein [Candidatus Moranbacteria bacterium]
MEHIPTKRKKGFSLIEIMVAIGIVAILAAVVLVSMQSIKAKGQSAKALGQLSSVIPSMVSCWGNGGGVRPPASGSDICSIGNNYGDWPQTTGDLSSYSFGNSTANNSNCPSGVTGNCLDKSAWYFSLTSGTVNRICCNSVMKSCKVQYYESGAWSEGCNATTPSN